MTLAELKRATLQMFLPPRKVTVSEWADENRILVSKSSAEPGRWRTNKAPYQREIMDCFTDEQLEKVVVMACAQCGKSEMLNNLVGYTIDVDPCSMMFVQGNEGDVKEYSKERIAPMIEACATLAKKVGEQKTRDGSNTIMTKEFPGGFLSFAGANAPAGLRSKPIRRLFLDEVDSYPKSAGKEGDPVKLAMKRTTTFQNRMIVLCSTPTIKGASKIETEYKLGTQEEWCSCCPSCGEWHFIRFPDIQFEYDTEIIDRQTQFTVTNVRWRCPSCLESSDEYTMKRAKAKWIARNPKAIEKRVRSFRLNSFMSPWTSWDSTIQKFLEAKDRPEDLQVFYNTELGETWELRDRSGEPEKLMERREWYGAELPDGVLVLTCGVDTQDDRLEYEVVGWGRGDESWGIQRGVLPGDPETDAPWKQLDMVLTKEWTFKNGKALRISVTFVDSGGHKAQNVYRQTMERYHHNVFSIKGFAGMGKPYVEYSKTMRKKGVHFFNIGVDSGKAAIMSATTVETAGPKYCHFPLEEERGYNLSYFNSLLSETMELTTRGATNHVTWVLKPGVRRNEMLDCRNYARAGFKAFPFNLDEIERTIRGIRRATNETVQRRQKTRKLSAGIQV